ncbi:IS256 family transposase [Thermus thermophilus]|uniref:IS256 family transposase n=1 Tax=Thermus thermophilus TaxID=274 RepID=UPI00194F02DA|nr:IS256 family transposase [Thermus thermophilus]BCP97781.1 IS256 family transposase [Thermus thermophilus]BCQ00112.1 IS256 family transposase [Thermus thermophilus]
MPRAKERGEGKPLQTQDSAWLDGLVDELYSRMAQGEHPGLAFLLEALLNKIMERERARFLASLEGQGEQANGFYPRKLHLTLGQLNLKVPRVRYAKAFRPALLPPKWKRVDKDYGQPRRGYLGELLIAMLANGYSQAQLQRALASLDLPFSEEALEEAKALIQDRLDFYKSQPLKADWFAVFLDAYWAKLRTEKGKLVDLSLFVAVGIDLEGRKEILGFWILEGRESKGFWVQVFQDLMARGVHRVLLFVTDDFRGLGEVIAKLFPYAEHQLCLLHLERNLRAKLSPSGYKEARETLRRIRHARDKEEGQILFGRLVEGVKGERPGVAREMEGKRERYLAFLGYPAEVRGHIYTTNVVESLNAGIERMRLELGGYFPSREALEVNLFLQVVNLQDRWWRRPIPNVQAKSYELKQLFALRYELDEEVEGGLHNF